MADLEALMNEPSFIGSVHEFDGKSFTVALADNFSYTDPIDGSLSSKQVLKMSLTENKMSILIHFDPKGIADHFPRWIAYCHSPERHWKLRGYCPPLHR